MSDDVRNEPLPCRIPIVVRWTDHFVIFALGRRAVLQSLATGVGAAVLRVTGIRGARASGGGSRRRRPQPPPRIRAALVFLDRHAFDTLAILGEQIVPGSRAAKVPEFLDRLLAVESTDTQKRFMQALGAFEREAREAHGKPWKSLTAAEATAMLTKISDAPDSDDTRGAVRRHQGRRRRDLLFDRSRNERTRLERQHRIRAARCLRLIHCIEGVRQDETLSPVAAFHFRLVCHERRAR